MTEYTFMVCGLVFNSDQSKIALIPKNRPKFLAGKMNGIGGKVEIGEGHAESMSREFEEETGCKVPQNEWEKIGNTYGGNYTVVWYRATLPDKLFNNIHTTTDEEIHIIDCSDVLSYPLDSIARIYILASLENADVLVDLHYD